LLWQLLQQHQLVQVTPIQQQAVERVSHRLSQLVWVMLAWSRSQQAWAMLLLPAWGVLRLLLLAWLMTVQLA
jgi:hypothetical protein